MIGEYIVLYYWWMFMFANARFGSMQFVDRNVFRCHNIPAL